jgi:indolepyruvate ferredoxin oxidoreductase
MTIAETRRFSLDDRYRAEPGTVYLTGVQAIVRMLLDQRRHDQACGLDTRLFISGYEGSPLAGLDLELARRQPLLDEHGIVFRPGLNEESAAMAVEGTQLGQQAGIGRHDGVTGIWYGKAPGLDRASDALRHASLMGTHRHGGALAMVGDDPAAKSSTVPSGSELALADFAMPVLYPADPVEIVTLGLHGIAMSRLAGLWAGLKIVTAVADGSMSGELGTFRPATPDMEIDGVPWRHQVTGRMLQPALGQLERDIYRARLEIARRYARANELNQIPVRGPNDTIGLVAAGKNWLDLRQALALLGLGTDAALAQRGIRLLKLGMVWPLEPGIVREFGRGLREIVVVEERRAFTELAVKDVLYGSTDAPAVYGKRGPDDAPMLAEHGELDPYDIAVMIAPRLGVPAPAVTRRPVVTLSLTPRTPYFCSGCPHNTSTRPAEGSLVGAGIGCHAMVLMMDPRQVGQVTGLTQMGGEGTTWIGMAPFTDTRHFVQNIGDGTYHSGSLAIRAAVASGVNITYKLLHNGAVAMTGGQDAVGALSVPAITRLLAAEGVSRIIVTSDDPGRWRGARFADGVRVWQRDRLDEAQRVLAEVPGVTVLIHDQECAAEKRRKRRRGTAATPAARIMINERVCEGCGDCGAKSSCVSVQPADTEFGRKTRIDQSSCNFDYSCVNGDCPSFVQVIPGRRVSRPVASSLAADAFPSPQAPSREDVTIRIAGVGGTGVVTVAQVLAVAAVIAGRQVRAMDQTGLAQKGGAVVSDLKITAGPFAGAPRLVRGECDLYLGADLLAAADAGTLEVTDADRTVAVISTTKVPTGRMITDTSASFPDMDAVTGRISQAVRASTWLDARGLSDRLFGSDQYANILLAGAAYQAGALPLPAAAIEEAISLNGVAVERNIQAFRRGRQVVADPASLEPAAVSPASPAVPGLGAPEGSELARLAGIRVAELTAYQDAAYASRYLAEVERVRAAEEAVVPGSAALAEAVAVNLFKLLAYKDEYEVARLSLGVGEQVRERFGDDARYSWKLHPPVLRALGVRHKITLGPWFRPVFSVLYGLRRLRGTRLDVFGYTRVRRLERALIAEYRQVIDAVLGGLTPETLARAVQIAALPDLVRGYEQVKLDSVARYRSQLSGLGMPSSLGEEAQGQHRRGDADHRSEQGQVGERRGQPGG